jgi:two-component system sensor histidine kinase KdpD
MARGILRIYLGAAPGVGKTFAMLDEGHRRQARGTDVVAAAVEAQGRSGTEAALVGIETVPWSVVELDGVPFEELDLDAVLARRPQVALIDDLAHINAPGGRHQRRWQDVDELLAAGIDVITTLNVQHLDSLSDVVEAITGYGEPHTVPDAFVRNADQIELVDMSPEALRRRLAHGNVYPAEQVDAALAHFFRPGNLAALRELALLWVADRVDDALQSYLGDHGITRTWETRERVVVALTGAPSGDRLIRRAARIAGRAHGELIGVHVAHPGSSDDDTGLNRQRSLLTELGGTYREVVSTDIAGALAAFAGAEQATQVVLGATRRGRMSRLLRGSMADDLQRELDGVDVHIIAADHERPTASTRMPARISAVPRRRERIAWAMALVGEPLLTFAVVHLQSHLNLGSALLLQLAFVVAVSAVGGIRPGVLTSVVAFLSTNWFLTPPLHTLSIADTDDLIALSVFVAISLAVSVLVDRTARRSRDALRARADATALARTTGSIIGSGDPMPELVDQLRALFSADAVAVLQRTTDGWSVVTSSGGEAPHSPAEGTAIALDAQGHTQLVLKGATIGENDQHVLRAFADQMALGLEAHRLRTASASMAALTEANVLRTALLQSVSHDLRTPLASIKASVTGLMADDTVFTPADRASLLEAIDTSADRLDRVVGNLLDMSRLQAGATRPTLAPTALEEVVAAALAAIAAAHERIRLDVSDSLPLVLTDAALMERAIANVVSNALAWSPVDVPVRIDAALVQHSVALRVVDRGPGIPAAMRPKVFEPFQRMGDRSNDAGVGLGLAIAKGFMEATGGAIEVDDTPGGGTTFTFTIPVVEDTIPPQQDPT